MVSLFRKVTGGGLTVTVDARTAHKAMKDAPERVRIEMTRAFERIGAKWERSVKLGFTGYTGSSRPGSLQNRSGALRRSVRFHVSRKGRLKDLDLSMIAGGGDVAYARSQEYGAIIRPKKSRFLTVPLPGALTPSGQLKKEAQIRGGGGKFTTDLGPTFIFRSDAGNLFVAVTPGSKKRSHSGKGKIRLLYILKRQVTLPGPRTTGTPSRLGGERNASFKGPNASFIEQALDRGLARAFTRPA